MTEAEWYEKHNCSHAHCKYLCEHPQPFMLGEQLVCGRCAIIDNEINEMIPCTPEICDD